MRNHKTYKQIKAYARKEQRVIFKDLAHIRIHIDVITNEINDWYRGLPDSDKKEFWKKKYVRFNTDRLLDIDRNIENMQDILNILKG